MEIQNISWRHSNYTVIHPTTLLDHWRKISDYAGPITIKTWKGRGAKTYKAWICVFVCLATSAIHIEVVGDYSAKRFGADKELKKLFIQRTKEHHHITTTLMNDHAQWEFNPPAAPHMGGKWEAAVKSVKFHINRTTRDASVTIEEINTLLTQIEAILNSRPIQPLMDDPNDCSALTPGHFLIGEPLNTLPDPSASDPNASMISRWQFIQKRVQRYWKQWRKHYLQQFLSTFKWHHPSNTIKVGSLVLITDQRQPQCKWPLARVMKLHPGKDGLTRVVTLKTTSSIISRPIHILAPLPVPIEDTDINHQ
ncbi:PREDICTED: uncharacterized protein LOC105361121 [Ceratosolen solmsi marchali]|uniref:Uncharacterized protein LOC105361121 n=1 Tax=Ceratosolen solmsi marchali TaxID=326594 RepID=A0AAJ7DU33_9HYME|nr:PREDICTED: uncharacterized protein LOC105361121 [Ceratosolen solmsi marchali]